MKDPRLLLAIVCALILSCAFACFADTQERIAPPEDRDVLHLSVVGVPGEAHFQQLLTMFEGDEKLSALRRRTHFHVVRADSEIYKYRYAANVKGLPTVRLQDAEGVILYETAGPAVPRTPDTLVESIEAKTSRKCFLPWRRQENRQCILPWRRQMEEQGQQEFTPENLPPLPMDAPPALPPLEPEPDGVEPWLGVLFAVLAAGGGFVGAVLGSARKELGE